MISSLPSLLLHPLDSHLLQFSCSAPGSDGSVPPCKPGPPPVDSPESPAPAAVSPAILPNLQSAPSSSGWSDAGTLRKGHMLNLNKCKLSYAE